MQARQVFAPRRLFAALLLFLGLSLAMVGAAGVGQVPVLPTSAPPPASFTMAEARIGDRGNYTWSRVALDAGGNATVLEEHEHWGFAWLPPKAMRDKAGRLHDTNTLHLWGWQRGDADDTDLDAQGWQRHTEPVYAIDRTDRTVVSYSYVSETAEDPNQRYGGHHMVQSMLLDEDDGFRPNCGPLSPWQGRNVPLDEDVTLFEACAGFGNAVAAARLDGFRAMASQSVEGRQTVLFSASSGKDVHVWYETGIPVPVRVAIESGPDQFDVLRLTRFTRGTVPLVWGGAAPQEPAPQWTETPLQGGLPEESGIDHPFPASAALEAARGHPEADAFFHALGQGYLTFLDYREGFDAAPPGSAEPWRRIVRTWDLAAYDGTSNPAISVTWRREVTEAADPAGPLPVPLPPLPPPIGPAKPQPWVNVTVEVLATTDRGGSRHPDPGLAPGSAPTVASMFERWRAFATDEYQAMAPNQWGFRITCLGECDSSAGLFVERWAGHGSSISWANGTMESHSSELSESFHAGRGHEATLHESTHRWESGGAAAPKETTVAPSGTPMRLERAWSWVTPGAAVMAGTGVAAFFVGLGYLLWPAIKSGAFVGLFSRERSRTDILDHPVRSRLLQLVEANPGIHLRDLQRRAAVGRNQLDHHLAKLRATGALRLVAGPGYTCAFAAGARDAPVMGAAAVLKAAAAKGILRAAIDRPGVGPRDVARAHGLSPGTVSHHVRRLREAGLIEGAGPGILPTELGVRAAMAG